MPALVSGQEVKPNWQNLDLQTDSVFGVSTERAYKELLGKPPVAPVLVAVIDGGFDVKHEALQGAWWHNPKEIPGNGKDDDGDGYVDDVYGWNFIGSAKGTVGYDNLELTRLLRKEKSKYGTVSDTMRLSAVERDSLATYRLMSAEYDRQLQEAREGLANIQAFVTVLDGVVSKMETNTPTLQDFQKYQPQSQAEAQVVQIVSEALRQGEDFTSFKAEQLDMGVKHFKEQVDYNLNFDFDPRPLVGDNPADERERLYGNADVVGPDALHGTHVAGIIGAARGVAVPGEKAAGVKGIVDAVSIITVRAIPEGDERDKDVANAIRYAVDRGARVINMSFGKEYSGDKAVVDDAVKYAMSKDVLLVHAAGNDGKDLDKTHNFPTPVYGDGSGKAGAWIEVGASTWKDDESLVAPFSNYGATSVDLFAPGARITSTAPGSHYMTLDGTSMAAPVVTGVAALIRSRYPKLTALQVKEILMKSVTKVTHDVVVRDGSVPRHVPFSAVCVAGGVVNAYNALRLAATYK